MIPSSACPPCQPDLTGKPSRRARYHRRSYTTLWGTISVSVSSVAQFELWYGVGKSANRQRNAMRLNAFFDGPIEIVTFDSEDAQKAGLVRAELEAVGRPIGPYDLLMAGQAMRHGMTLVTANHREFARVKGLQWIDWARG